MLKIWNEDCISGAKSKLPNESVDLIICDPPFGINETTFDKHYKRNEGVVIGGYVEAPSDYSKFTSEWVGEAKRILKENGTFYIISGWTNLVHILNAIENHGLITLNHCIWKFNFGVAATKKFVTSHYHVLRVAKSDSVYFNTHCRFGPQEKDDKNGSLLYKDLEDVFVINKEFSPREVKNKNKLPSELISKLVMYSSKEGDTVCDFFMGNFTTAKVAYGLGRNVYGFEMNKESYDYHYPLVSQMKIGCDIEKYKKVEIIIPQNKGKKVSESESAEIVNAYKELSKSNTQKDSIVILCEKYGRGRFSIINIVKKANKNEAL